MRSVERKLATVSELGVAQGQVGEARQPRLEAVNDVEPSLGERERQVGAHADGYAELAPARHRNGRPDGDQVGILLARERPPTGSQVGRRDSTAPAP